MITLKCNVTKIVVFQVRRAQTDQKRLGSHLLQLKYHKHFNQLQKLFSPHSTHLVHLPHNQLNHQGTLCLQLSIGPCHWLVTEVQDWRESVTRHQRNKMDQISNQATQFLMQNGIGMCFPFRIVMCIKSNYAQNFITN